MNKYPTYATQESLEASFTEVLLEVLSSQDFWIGAAFTISVVGIACLLFGNRGGRSKG